MKKTIILIIIILISLIFCAPSGNHTITIDGSPTDWLESEIIATDKAWDHANCMNGAWATHETPFDYNRLLATWDDNYLYIGIQIVDVTDITDPANAGSSHGSPPTSMNLVQWIAIDYYANKGYSGVDGNGADAGEYDMWHKGQLFGGTNKPDWQIYFASNFWQGPFLCPYEVSGVTGWDPDANTSGPSSGLEGASGAGSKFDIIGNAPDYSSSQNSNYDYSNHDRSRDSFFEIAIPWSVLGLTKSDAPNLSIMVGQGEGDKASGVDSIPDDPATLDLHGVESYNSPLEWGDVDIFTAPFASLGSDTTNSMPSVTLTNPTGGENLSGTVSISWTASDNDGDNLTFIIQYSTDGSSWTDIATDVTGTSYDWNTASVSDGATYKIKITVSDGQASSSAITSSSINISNGGRNEHPEDMNEDNVVDGLDLIILAIAFGSNPGDSAWNNAADLNSDGTIDGLDLIILAINFGKSY